MCIVASGFRALLMPLPYIQEILKLHAQHERNIFTYIAITHENCEEHSCELECMNKPCLA